MLSYQDVSVGGLRAQLEKVKKVLHQDQKVLRQMQQLSAMLMVAA
jgi:hypothetical protein